MPAGKGKSGNGKVLSKTQRAKIKMQLISRQKELQTRLKRPIDGCGSESDLNCRANQEEDVHIDLSQRDLWQKELKRTEVVLANLDNKEFGICEDCGDPIDPERLLAHPLVTRCHECKEQSEGDGHSRRTGFQAAY